VCGVVGFVTPPKDKKQTESEGGGGGGGGGGETKQNKKQQQQRRSNQNVEQCYCFILRLFNDVFTCSHYTESDHQ